MCGIDTIQHAFRNGGSGCYVRNGTGAARMETGRPSWWKMLMVWAKVQKWRWKQGPEKLLGAG